MNMHPPPPPINALVSALAKVEAFGQWMEKTMNVY